MVRVAHQNNEQNLIPFNERTEDERRELASKAGKASGAARRKKRTMKATAKMLFDLPITSKELKQKLALLGVDTDKVHPGIPEGSLDLVTLVFAQQTVAMSRLPPSAGSCWERTRPSSSAGMS